MTSCRPHSRDPAAYYEALHPGRTLSDGGSFARIPCELCFSGSNFASRLKFNTRNNRRFCNIVLLHKLNANLLRAACSCWCRVAQAEAAAAKAEQERGSASQHAAVAEAKMSELQAAVERAEARAHATQKPAAARGRVPIPSPAGAAVSPSHEYATPGCPPHMRALCTASVQWSGPAA